jgi:hypothetical protein
MLCKIVLWFFLLSYYDDELLHTCLTHKIPCVFLPNSVVFDTVGKINFSKNKSMRI